MDNRLILKVRDFSLTPGSRNKDEGLKANSGQEYREDVLEPEFKKAVEGNKKILMDLDGTVGYGTSWLEEVFGGLARTFSSIDIQDYLEFKSDEEPYLIDDIKDYINDAKTGD